MSTYILQVDDAVGTYPEYDNYVTVVLAAYDRALRGLAATVVQVDGPANDLRFTPLVTVGPPLVPTISTSPKEVPA